MKNEVIEKIEYHRTSQSKFYHDDFFRFYHDAYLRLLTLVNPSSSISFRSTETWKKIFENMIFDNIIIITQILIK